MFFSKKWKICFIYIIYIIFLFFLLLGLSLNLIIRIYGGAAARESATEAALALFFRTENNALFVNQCINSIVYFN